MYIIRYRTRDRSADFSCKVVLKQTNKQTKFVLCFKEEETVGQIECPVGYKRKLFGLSINEKPGLEKVCICSVYTTVCFKVLCNTCTSSYLYVID